MVDDARRATLREVGIQGRVAFALVCIGRAIRQRAVRDPRIDDAVVLLWHFVQERNFVAVLDACAAHPVVRELLDAVDEGREIPAGYHTRPPYLPVVLNATRWIAVTVMYQAILGHGQESLDPTVQVADLCARDGVPLPPVRPFATLRFSDDFGRGHVTSRTAVLAALARSAYRRQGDHTWRRSYGDRYAPGRWSPGP
jgi:hypothetical protein